MKDGNQTKVACLAGISNLALAGDNLPDALKLLAWGENKTQLGTFVVNQRTATCIAQQVKDGLFDRVLIDFEHNSCKNHPNYQPPPRLHAGAAVPICDKDSGLCTAQCTWTPSGRKYAREYPDLSPAVEYDEKTREVIGLKSVALVPNGAVIGLSFFSADDTHAKQETTMDPELKAALEKIEARLATLETEITLLKEQLATLSTSGTDLKGKVETLSAKTPDDLTATLDVMKVRLIEVEKSAMLEVAVAQGKVVGLAADVMAGMKVEQLREHIKGIKPTVPLAQLTAAADKGGGGGAAQLSATQKMLTVQLGIKEPEKVFLEQK